jgi:hypothetical protein
MADDSFEERFRDPLNPPTPDPRAALRGAMTPPEPAAPEPPPNPLDSRIEEDRRKAEEHVQKAESAFADEERALRPSSELESRRHALMSELERPLPKHPQLREAPPAPQVDTESAQSWIMASMLIGALAGAFTRNHVTNALGAMQGALDGYAAGNQQKFNNDMKVWQTENQRAIEANENALTSYREIMEDRKLTIEQKSIELQIAAQQHKDEAMATAARAKNELTIAQLYDKQAQAQEKLKSDGAKIAERRDEFQQRQALAQMRALGIDPNKADSYIDAIGRGDLPAVTGARGAAIMELVTQRYPDYDATKFRAKAAAATAEARTTATAGANIDIVMRGAGPVIERAAQAAAKVPATAFPYINKVIQSAAEASGDPAIRNFQLANMELATTLARALNPRSNIVTNYMRREAEEKISTADSPEAYQAILNQIKATVEREHGVIEQQKRGEPMPPINATVPERKLQPTPRQILPKAGGPLSTYTGKPTGGDYDIPGPFKPQSSLPEGWSSEQVA